MRLPRNIIMPSILVFSIVGAYAVNKSLFDVVVMLSFGVIAFIIGETGFPSAPAILGVILGATLENCFVTAMISSEGHLLSLVERPIAALLAIFVAVIWLAPPLLRLYRCRKDAAFRSAQRSTP